MTEEFLPLSAGWRIRGASVPEIDLRHIQEAVQALLESLIGPDVRVSWTAKAGECSSRVRKAVWLSFAPLQGQPCPAPPERVDVVVGAAIHEAGHLHPDFEGKWEKVVTLLERRKLLSRISAVHQVANLLEDAWIDNMTARRVPAFGAYLKRLRRFYRDEQAVRRLLDRLEDPQPLSWEELFTILVAGLLYGVDVLTPASHRSAPDAADLMRTLAEALEIGVEAMEKLPASYSSMVMKCWRTLREYVDTWRGEEETAEDEPFGGGQWPVDETSERSDKGSEETCFPKTTAEPSSPLPACPDIAPLPYYLAQRVEEALESQAELVDPEVAGYKGFILKRPSAGSPITARQDIADAIRNAFSLQMESSPVPTLFQETGRLSQRTLGRALFGERRLFEEREPEQLDMAVGVLVDASGSINMLSWWVILETCQALVDALRDFPELHLEILAYQSDSSYILFEPGYDGVRHNKVGPSGDTPSVPALRTMVDRLSKLPQRDKLVIHFTDGGPNCHGDWADMRREVEETERKGIPVIGIGVDESSADQMERLMETQYSRWRVISSIDEFPEALGQALTQGIKSR